MGPGAVGRASRGGWAEQHEGRNRAAQGNRQGNIIALINTLLFVVILFLLIYVLVHVRYSIFYVKLIFVATDLKYFCICLTFVGNSISSIGGY